MTRSQSDLLLLIIFMSTMALTVGTTLQALLWGYVVLPIWIFISGAYAMSREIHFAIDGIPSFKINLRALFGFTAWLAIGLALYANAQPELQKARKQEQQKRLEGLMAQELANFHERHLSSFADPVPARLQGFRDQVRPLHHLKLQSNYARELRALYDRQLKLAEEIGAVWEQYSRNSNADPWEAERSFERVSARLVQSKYYPLAQERDPGSLVREALADILLSPALIEGEQLQQVLTEEKFQPLSARLLLVDVVITTAQQRLAGERPNLKPREREAEAIKRLRQKPSLDALLGELPQ